MASNLVSYIAQLLTPDMIARIASALGLDTNKVQGAVNAAIPAVLAGLTGVAAQPGGAQRIADTASQQGGSLDNLLGMLAGGDQASLAQSGSQIISSLFGARDGNALAGAIGNVSGMDPRTSGSLLATLAPLVMGGLARQSGDVSANGIAGLLASQKDNIAAALPAGARELLGGSGLLSALGGSAQSAAASVGQTARDTAATVGTAAERTAAAATPSGSRNWLYWVIAVLALAAVLFYLFGKPGGEVAPEAGAPGPGLTVGGIDIGQQVQDSMASLQTTLTGITDAASATAALPKLEEISGGLDKVAGAAGQLSAEQKAALSALVGPMMPTLNGLFDKVLAIPGVSDILKPAIDALKAKLTSLAA